jgi:hypothetical protein
LLEPRSNAFEVFCHKEIAVDLDIGGLSSAMRAMEIAIIEYGDIDTKRPSQHMTQRYHSVGAGQEQIGNAGEVRIQLDDMPP